jgi:hypothetical protein
MKLDLQISGDERALLEQQATALGQDVSRFVLDAVREKISAVEPAEPDLPDDQWLSRLKAFAARHEPTGHPLDDSRESMYADRT